MTLEDFKTIFFWEYVHRLLGRLIGLAFALPLLWFWWRRAIPDGYGWKLGGLLALGGLQGAIGWWMVASGLVDVPEVSHIRLAVHLLIALLIFAGMVWVALDLRALAGTRRRRRCGCRCSAIWALCLLFLQFLFGAYVAGLEAGYAFNSWPKMGEEWFPAGSADARAVAAQLRRQSDRGPVRPPLARLRSSPAFAIWLGMRAWRRGHRSEGALLIGAVTARSCSASSPCCRAFRSASPSRTRAWRCCCSARDGRGRAPARGEDRP